jgi:hypothetical protein
VGPLHELIGQLKVGAIRRSLAKMDRPRKNSALSAGESAASIRGMANDKYAKRLTRCCAGGRKVTADEPGGGFSGNLRNCIAIMDIDSP